MARVVLVLSIASWVGALSTGCSAFVNPDESRLGGADDGGRPRADGGMAPVDAGTPGDAGGGRDAAVPPQPDAGAPCEGLPRCAGGVLTTCQHDMPVTTMCPLGCASSDTPRCLEMVPSNVDASLWDPRAPSLDIPAGDMVEVDTTECSMDMIPMHVVPQASAPVDLCVASLNDLHIRAGATLRVTGSRPLVIMAAGSAQIEGTLDASATLDAPGAGGFAGGVVDPIDGRGVRGGQGGQHTGLYADGGGGGGGLCGAGGSGGSGGSASGGLGGMVFQSRWTLVPLFGGSGGGRGRGSIPTSGSNINAGLGGAGGGAIQISARGQIDLRGEILVGGGGGRGGDSAWGYNAGAGGGGGSGGAVLLEAPVVTLGAAALLDAAGGGGGGGSTGSNAVADGTDGRDTRDRAAGGVTGMMSGGSGGMGGGGTTLDGAAGDDVSRSDGNGGGGGGGAGCLLVRDANGSLPAIGGRTPSVTPGLRALPVQTQ